MFLPPWFVRVETLVILTTSRGLESTFNQPLRRFIGNSTNLAGGTFSQTFSLGSLCEGSSRRVLIVVGFIYLNWGWHSSQRPVSSLPKNMGIPSLYPDKHHPKSAALVSHVSRKFLKFFQASDRIRARHPFWHVSYTKWPSIEILCFLEGWICLLGIWGWKCLGSNKREKIMFRITGGQAMWVMCFFVF